MSQTPRKKKAVKRKSAKLAKRSAKRPVASLTDAEVIRRLFPREVIAKANKAINHKPKRSS
jgi:hypothetical protein